MIILDITVIFALFILTRKKKNHMKIRIIITACLMAISTINFAQATITNGPELDNDRDSKLNRMLGGDDNSFYCYRVRSKGKGTSFIVEKYDKKTLKPLFSKEVNLDEEKKTKIEDVEYANGKVFVFRRQYDKKTDKMTLFYQTITSEGTVDEQLKEIVSINSDHYEFVNFDIFPNPSQTKFLIKASHKPNKESFYQTDFILMDAINQKKLWTKTVDEKLFSNTEGKTVNFVAAYSFGTMIDLEDLGFIGLYLDDQDNVYFGYTAPSKKMKEKQEGYKLTLGILNSNEDKVRNLELAFDDDYFVRDIEFSKTKTNEIVVGGYIKDVQERKGVDLVKVGIFSFSIDLSAYQVKSKSVKFFDDEMLKKLESNSKRARKFKYKLDYIYNIGDAVYYVGEQYKEEMVVRAKPSPGMGGMGALANTAIRAATHTDVDYHYEYMDVIVAKLNSKGEFEWVKNLPLRQEMRLEYYSHVFKQYIAIATNDNIYILCDDHPKNIERYQKADFEPKDLKSVTGIHGSNFVCNQLNLKTGQIMRQVLMKNDDYCFAPIQERNKQFIPPSDCEIFVPGNNGEIFIYTEDRGRDRFAKIKFD